MRFEGKKRRVWHPKNECFLRRATNAVAFDKKGLKKERYGAQDGWSMWSGTGWASKLVWYGVKKG